MEHYPWILIYSYYINGHVPYPYCFAESMSLQSTISFNGGCSGDIRKPPSSVPRQPWSPDSAARSGLMLWSNARSLFSYRFSCNTLLAYGIGNRSGSTTSKPCLIVMIDSWSLKDPPGGSFEVNVSRVKCTMLHSCDSTPGSSSNNGKSMVDNYFTIYSNTVICIYHFMFN